MGGETVFFMRFLAPTNEGTGCLVTRVGHKDVSIGLNIQFSYAATVATILTDYIPGVRKKKILVRSVSMVL